ncbi:MAG: sulfotransferase [Coleofasciculus sp. C1-SOL-03]|uniref:sulfotransferase n=1 Tax=Coleofasciculus sp. C1-SOL-03 TaxID=3069522 RepID=UPI0032FDB586
MEVKYGVVLGCPRSGTTFLMQVLQALPYSECVSGKLLPISIPHIVNYPLAPEIYESLSFGLEFACQDYLASEAGSRFAAIHKWLLGCMTIPELIDTFQRTRIVKRFIYKEPFLSFAPEFTYQALPNCRILYIYRDGRDCADSLVRTYDVLTDQKLMHLRTSEMPLGRQYDHRYVPWWVESGKEEEFISCTPYVRAIWMWKEMVRRCHDFFTKPEVMASGRVLFVKYEDLVTDPLFYGKSIVEHFGATMNNQLYPKIKKASPRSIGIHKKRDSREIEWASKVANSELKFYGYL